MKKSIVIILVLILGFNSFGQTSSHKELEKSINDLFQSYAHYDRFIGNVLISQDDTIIYKKSFGYADIDNHKKNKSNSVFSIASVTKSLTAVAIMKLVEDGKLSLETPISSYFPNFIPDFSKKITIRHLLNHSSGMQANIGRIDDEGNGFMPGKKAITLNELFEKFKNSELKFEPGTGYEYNNFGYTLLAYIIESVSKQSYADYMEHVVFIPANMKNTTVNTYKSLHKKAFSHIGLGTENLKKYHSKIHSSGIKGAGNIKSTSIDLYNFMHALQNHKLLKPSSVNMLYGLTQKMNVNNSEYGLGWKIEINGDEKWINHTGLLPGYTSIIGSLPKRKINIIILSNATSTDLITDSDFQGKSQFVSSDIIEKLIAVLQGKKTELLPTPIKLKHKSTVDFSRTYKMDDKHSLVLTKQENKYALKTIGSDPWSVFTYPFSKDVKEENASSNIALLFANAWSTQNFDGMTKHANADMKELFETEKGINMLKNIWGRFIKENGKFQSYNIYKTEGSKVKKVHIRFHFEKKDIGILLAFNSESKIQGFFNDPAVKRSDVTKVALIPVGENIFFINGFQNNGMQDLKIKISEKELILIDGNINFKATLKSSL